MKRRMFGAANSRRVPKSMVRAYTIEQVAVTNRSGFSSVRNGHFLREHFKTGLREKPTRFRLMGRPHGLNPLKFGLEPKDRPRSYFLGSAVPTGRDSPKTAADFVGTVNRRDRGFRERDCRLGK